MYKAMFSNRLVGPSRHGTDKTTSRTTRKLVAQTYSVSLIGVTGPISPTNRD